MPDDLKKYPHRRLNPLTGEWVLVSPQRGNRPWLGEVEKTEETRLRQYDPSCYLCPGNERVGGVANPQYTGTFVFNNDFPALLPDAPAESAGQGGNELLRAEIERGICRVLCFSPRHDLTVPLMQPEAVTRVVDAWCDQYRELAAIPFIQNIQVFENRGAMMGASNPHPHCQIWANQSVPNEIVKETAGQSAYFKSRGSCLLCDYLKTENGSERVIVENELFAVLVPYWAVWPFETILISKRHFASMPDLTLPERAALADAMRQITIRYDNLFNISFPYSMGFHQQPLDGAAHPEWHFHAHYAPPLLRSATVRKFMVGYELFAGPQRDITPETAAARLREMPATHY